MWIARAIHTHFLLSVFIKPEGPHHAVRAFKACGGESGLTEDAVQRGAAVWALALGHTTAVLFLNVTGERLLCLALHAVSLACVALSHGVLLCWILAATGPWPAVRRLTVGLNGPPGHCGTRVLCVKVPNVGQNAGFLPLKTPRPPA